MKRALIVGTGTLAGVAAVLALNPEPASLTASADTVLSSTTTPDTTTPDTSTPESTTPESTTPESTTPESTTPDSGSLTVTGPAVDVGRGYGEAQVEIPANDHHSESISRRAWPTLVEQALAAQSADIAGVSGATYTSAGFAESLRAALQEAGLS
jgi:hypothetical protein